MTLTQGMGASSSGADITLLGIPLVNTETGKKSNTELSYYITPGGIDSRDTVWELTDPGSSTGTSNKVYHSNVQGTEISLGGTDAETDDAFRLRAAMYYQTLTRGTVAALQAGALRVDGITYATVHESISAQYTPFANIYTPSVMVSVAGADQVLLEAAMRDTLVAATGRYAPGEVMYFDDLGHLCHDLTEDLLSVIVTTTTTTKPTFTVTATAIKPTPTVSLRLTGVNISFVDGGTP